MSLPRTDPGGAPEPGPQSSFRRERLRFSEFSFTRSPSGHVSINVELEYDGQKWFGRSAGQSSPLGDLCMAAEAALRALEEFAEGSLSFELIGVKHIRAFDSNLVIVSIAVRDSAGTRLVGCYLAFGSGVFCRQIIDMAKFSSVSINPANLRLSSLVASFIVGLAIFPFLVRYVRKLADYVSGEENKSALPNDDGAATVKEQSHSGWNMIHVFTSFTTGFFVNLVYEKVLQMIQTQMVK